MNSVFFLLPVEMKSLNNWWTLVVINNTGVEMNYYLRKMIKFPKKWCHKYLGTFPEADFEYDQWEKIEGSNKFVYIAREYGNGTYEFFHPDMGVVHRIKVDTLGFVAKINGHGNSYVPVKFKSYRRSLHALKGELEREFKRGKMIGKKIGYENGYRDGFGWGKKEGVKLGRRQGYGKAWKNFVNYINGSKMVLPQPIAPTPEYKAPAPILPPPL